MNTLLKGFGCLALVLCISFTSVAKEIHGNPESPKSDTSIAATEMVTTAVSSSAENTVAVVIVKEEVKAAPEVTILDKPLVAKQNTYSSLHPMSVSFVRAYEKKHEARLEKITSKYVRQLALIDKIMIRHELPTDLKYLALIESELYNGAVSRKGAVGPWQFMATTGRLMGLTINRHKDERRDLAKSTNAAAKYLKILYNQFDDWLLVIAAYNGGASRVEAAIKKSRSRDFWKLQYYLPAESRAHVKKFVAARYILEKQDEERVPIINMEKLRAQNLNPTITVLHISGKYNTSIVAKNLDMEVAEFSMYNPGFDKEVITNGYDLRLPKDKMEKFNAKREEILNECIEVMLANNNTAFGNDRSSYPEAISLPTKAIISTGADRNIRRK
ncbi:lytic transglycosylase domain-containing protein [Agriterribacter sp.]|uniref:lytic transglycosylase domain-containing protein n=1 Tax=Agriterribacter sp. TaxID=2821509 RepID=UPI002B970D8A|nr:lytic transglycosylase domain-containing protein [Agriterribacter sp.]HRP54702.1 lytic transglycosylase domain-containing protein [Agriterribacter sp.]